jgi:hypothetical protein
MTFSAVFAVSAVNNHSLISFRRPVHIGPDDLPSIGKINASGTGSAKRTPVLIHLPVITHHLAALTAGHLEAGRTGQVIFADGNFHLLHPE